MRVIDITNPSAPQEVGFFDTPGLAYGLAVNGNFAYIADCDQGLRVVDISNPAAPQEVGFVDTPGMAYDVAVDGGYAYVADYSRGVRVVDVSNPAAPQEVGFFDTPGFAHGVAVDGDLVMVADRETGLFLLRNDLISKVAENAQPAMPEFELRQNYPNPFNPTTRFEYRLFEPAHVQLKITDLLGKTVFELVNEKQAAGVHRVVWNASAAGLASGIYGYELRTGKFCQRRKMVLLK
jgi:uncharacterized secreted protein with C-terminal beta-propeller domain